MKHSVLALIVMAVAGAACGGNSPTTPSTPAPSGSTETFAGSLPLQGSSFYSFTVATAETVSVSLASLTASGTGPAATSVVRLGVGVPLGTDCSVNNSVDTAAGLTSQLTAPLVNPDVYCVKISDIGNLAGPMNFTIRIGHNLASSSSNPTAATEYVREFSGHWRLEHPYLPCLEERDHRRHADERHPVVDGRRGDRDSFFHDLPSQHLVERNRRIDTADHRPRRRRELLRGSLRRRRPERAGCGVLDDDRTPLTVLGYG